MMDQLDVYLHDTKAGVLISDKGRMEFCYSPAYIEKPEAEPLAFSLPVRSEPYHGDAITPFFSNLLPDESVRVRIADILGISPENTFGLLKEIGEDCAGAVAFFTPDKAPHTLAAPVYRILSDDESDEILRHLAERPLNIGAEDFHISGAGAQDKLVAAVENGKILLPLRGTPSTHIIKPGIGRFPESVFNEFYCMRLAAACGLETASCDMLTIREIPYYITERYDRVRKGKIWSRLHQEDFCQLLGYDPKVKYESEGSPKLLQCFELLRKMEMPATDTIAFLDRIIFCFLIGNGDAHAKNFSVVYRDRKPRLAPAYDLLSTTVYPNLASRLAMKIDGEYNFRWITTGKLIRMGVKAGLSERMVKMEIQKIRKRLDKILLAFTETVAKEHPASIYLKIQAGIQERFNQLILE